MASEVEKVGVDNTSDESGGDGGQQPDTVETQESQNDAGGQDVADYATAPGGDETTTGDATGNDAETDPAATGEAGDGKRQKKDNGKVDFPIADAQYRNADGVVVTASTVGEAVADGETAGVKKLLAVPRPIFDEDGEVDATTGKKPVLYGGWNHRKHNPLKKGDFVDEAEYVNYTAFTFRIKAAVFMEKAKVAEKRAARLKKFGNQTNRKLVDKIAKMREQLAVFTAQAVAENIDISDLSD